MSKVNTIRTLKLIENSYFTGDYDDAITNSIDLKDNFDKSIYHYNLGTFFLKKQDFIAARYNLELAFLNNPLDGMAYANLSFAIRQLDKSKGVSKSLLSTWEDDFTFSLYSIPQQCFLTCSLFFFFFYLLFHKIKKNKTKWHRKYVFVLLFLPLFCQWIIYKNTYFALTVNNADIYEGPSSLLPVRGQIQSGVRLLINGPHFGWYFIKSPTQFSGWINRDHLGIY